MIKLLLLNHRFLPSSSSLAVTSSSVTIVYVHLVVFVCSVEKMVALYSDVHATYYFKLQLLLCLLPDFLCQHNR